MNHRVFMRAALLAACGAFTAWGGPILGTNWVINGDAESGAGSTDGSVVAVPGWTVNSGGFTAVQYEAAPGNFPAVTDPGPASRGNNFFAGGPNVAFSMASQVFAVSSFASQIDAGLIQFVLSGWLGGWQNQDYFAQWFVEFEDGGMNQIGSLVSLQSPNAAARSDQTGLFFQSTNGTIPTGTRFLSFQLDMTRLSGSYNDGYADNLSFVANASAGGATPEPGAMVLAATGIAALLALRRKAW